MELYVPADFADAPLGARRAAALVGVGRGAVVMVVCQQRTSPHGRFADDARAAANALRAGAGTRVPAEQLRLVGYFDEAMGEIRLRDRGALDGWVGRRMYRQDLEASDSLHETRMQARRDLRQALITGRPDKAAQIVNRHGWPGL